MSLKVLVGGAGTVTGSSPHLNPLLVLSSLTLQIGAKDGQYHLTEVCRSLLPPRPQCFG